MPSKTSKLQLNKHNDHITEIMLISNLTIVTHLSDLMLRQ